MSNPKPIKASQLWDATLDRMTMKLMSDGIIDVDIEKMRSTAYLYYSSIQSLKRLARAKNLAAFIEADAPDFDIASATVSELYTAYHVCLLMLCSMVVMLKYGDTMSPELVGDLCFVFALVLRASEDSKSYDECIHLIHTHTLPI